MRFKSISAMYMALTFCAIVPWRVGRGQDKPKAPLLFEAQPAGVSVRVGEPIYLRFRLKNTGSDTVLVKRRFRLNDTVSLQVRGPGGVQVPWCGMIPDWADVPGDFVFLAPGAHVEGIMRVNCDKRRKMTWGYRFPDPGNYILTASYELPYPLPVLKRAARSALVVKGPVAARPIRLSILPEKEPGLHSNHPQ